MAFLMDARLAEVVDAVGGHVSGDASVPGSIRAVSIDSRITQPGDLFFALAGETTDGHRFVGEALKRGAIACVVSHPVQEVPADRLIQVDNVEKALMRLAAWVRSKIKVPVAAITGSSGKSTTKEMTAQLLRRHFNVLAAPGSYNNEIGVPLTLLAFESTHQAVVLEMAMRGKGQIRELCEIARPTIGLITSIGEAHVGLLGSVDAIAEAKGELLESLPSDGAAFLNSSDPWTNALSKKAKCPVHRYGFQNSDEVHAVNITITWDGTRFDLVTPRGALEVILPLYGEHNLLNFLGAASIALHLGVPLPKIKEGARLCKTLHGRLERHNGKNGVLILDDSYNANPASVRAAIQTMAALPVDGRRILALGDMLELGSFGETEHSKIGKQVVKLDAVFALGELTTHTIQEAKNQGMKTAKHYPNHEAMIGDLVKFLKPGDLLLVKGSRKMTMEKIVERLAS